MPRQLNITPAPFKPSYLAIPPTPFSPLFPITPPASPPKDNRLPERAAQLKASAALLPPPSTPLHWLWQCHKCNRVYQLGVTRRCLDDGHFFCAGTTVVKRSKKHSNSKKILRHQACASEFDYHGWKVWGKWRRTVAEQAEAAEALIVAEAAFEAHTKALLLPPPTEGKWFREAETKKAGLGKVWDRPSPLVLGKKHCWDRCDYPSECRWGKQFGVQTPKTVVTSAPVPFNTPAAAAQQSQQAKALKTKTSFEEILGSNAIIEENVAAVEDEAGLNYLEPLSPTKSSRQKAVTEGETKTVSMDDLLESVKRRKRRSSGQLPSPLGANPPSPEEETGLVVNCSDVNSASSGVASANALQWTFDDFELDFKKSIANLPALQEKADAWIRGLSVGKKRFANGDL